MRASGIRFGLHYVVWNKEIREIVGCSSHHASSLWASLLQRQKYCQQQL
jgi:hypothetical protein